MNLHLSVQLLLDGVHADVCWRPLACCHLLLHSGHCLPHLLRGPAVTMIPGETVSLLTITSGVPLTVQPHEVRYQAMLLDTKPGSRVRQADVEHAACVVRGGRHAALRCRRNAVRQPAKVTQHLHPHPMPFDDAALLHFARISPMPVLRRPAHGKAAASRPAEDLITTRLQLVLIILICSCVAAGGTMCKRLAQCCGRISTCRMARSLRSARSMSTATSAALRLKFSRLKAYTLTHGTPSSRHHSSACTSCAGMHSGCGEFQGAHARTCGMVPVTTQPCEHSRMTANIHCITTGDACAQANPDCAFAA